MVYLNKKGGMDIYYGSIKKMPVGQTKAFQVEDLNCKSTGDVDHTVGVHLLLEEGVQDSALPAPDSVLCGSSPRALLRALPEKDKDKDKDKGLSPGHHSLVSLAGVVLPQCLNTSGCVFE